MSEIPDWRAVRMDEHPRNNPARRALQTANVVKLRFEHVPQLRRQWKHAPFPVFGFSGIQTKPTGVEVDVTPLAGKQLAFGPPAGDVGDSSNGLQVARKQLKHRLILLALEKPLARVVDVKHLELWPRSHLTGTSRQPERPAKHCEFVIDSRISDRA